MNNIKKIVKWSLIVLVGLIVLAIMTPEPKVIYKERECKECNCLEQEVKITKLKEVIELDNKAFVLTGDYMGRLDYWMLHPLEAEQELNKWTIKIDEIANEKWEIMDSLK